MSLKNRFRSGMAPSSESIPYGDHIEQDGCVYSIDKFRPRFRLGWGDLRPRIGGKLVPLSDEFLIDALRQDVLPYPYSQKGSSVCSWHPCDGLLVFLTKFNAFHHDQPFYSLMIEFNPNKLLAWDELDGILSRLKAALGDRFVWDDTRTDFTFDVPYGISDVRLLSRKQASSYLGTYYFGVRGQSGYTRVYNKRQEMLDHYHQDIGQDWTRIEFESRGGYPVNYDVPYLIGDLGNHEVLRFVPMDAWPDALRTFDPRTARIIKRDSLRRLPFDPAHFQTLYDRLLERLQLPTPFNVEFRNREEADTVYYDLEQISSELRKFAKEID